MLEIPWIRKNAAEEICHIRTYMLRRKVLNGTTIYEVWRHGDMKFNTTKYFEFMKHAQYIIHNKPGVY